MAEIVVMPKLGLTMETGTVGEWKVAEGDQITVGMFIAEIDTEKIAYELESQAEGVLLKIILPEGAEAEVGVPIAIIGQPGEDISAYDRPLSGAGAASAASQAATEERAALTAAPIRQGGDRIPVSPAAKKLASELGIDLASVRGTGPGGRITIDDVNAAAQAAPAAPDAARTEVFATPVARKLAAELGVDLARVAGRGPSGRVKAEDVTRGAPPAASAGGALNEIRGGTLHEIPYAGMRKMIGEHMDASRNLAPTVTYSGRADVEELRKLIAQINAARPDDDRVNVTAAVVKAVALTLETMPRLNATLEGDTIKVWRNINVGVAVALTEGLIVPVIRQANQKRLEEIAREIKELAGRARESKLLPDDISGGTFTVSTLGSYRSVDWFSPIINQPEAAILGVGRMEETVVAVDDEPAVHATMGLSLTCDHRIVDGAPAAEFLRILMDHLAQPLSILL